VEPEKDTLSLSAETLAVSIVLANLLSGLARIPAVRPAVVTCFDRSKEMAENATAIFGKSASPDPTLMVLRVIEEMRTMVLGAGAKPKDTV
jgi:hypothetical protein